MGEITRLLAQARQGDAQAESALLDALYRELHAIAGGHLRGQQRDHTIQATALLNEAWMRLARGEGSGFHDRGHFLAFASRAMRNILVDHARRRGRAKRTPGGDEVPLDQVALPDEGLELDLEALDRALLELSSFDPEMARAVDLRFFAGLPMSEVAETLGLSLRTLERRWLATRAWLRSRVE